MVGQTTLSLSVNPVPWSKSKSKRTENSKETRGGGHKMPTCLGKAPMRSFGFFSHCGKRKRLPLEVPLGECGMVVGGSATASNSPLRITFAGCRE